MTCFLHTAYVKPQQKTKHKLSKEIQKINNTFKMYNNNKKKNKKNNKIYLLVGHFY